MGTGVLVNVGRMTVFVDVIVEVGVFGASVAVSVITGGTDVNVIAGGFVMVFTGEVLVVSVPVLAMSGILQESAMRRKTTRM